MARGLLAGDLARSPGKGQPLQPLKGSAF